MFDLGRGDQMMSCACETRLRSGRLRGLALIATTFVVLSGVPPAALAAGRHPVRVGEWPLYGADLANSRTSAGGPSAAGAATLVQAWKFDVSDGDFTGTPVVKDGRVYVGSNGGVVRALDVGSGRQLWRTTVDGPVNGSLAVADGMVFVPVATVGDGAHVGPSVAAMDESTGQLKWQTTIDTQKGSDVFGSPTVADGVVYIGVSGFNGENNDPNVAVRGGIVALSADDGTVRWHTYTVAPGHDGGAVWSTPAVDLDAGVLFAGTGNAYHDPADPNTDSVLKVRLRDGAILQHAQATPSDAFSPGTPGPDVDFGASPNLMKAADGTPLVGEGQKSGFYWVFRRADVVAGDEVWSAPVGTTGPTGGIVGSTAYDGTRIYGPNTVPGYSWSLAAADGSAQWVHPGVDAAHYGPLSESNGVVYTADSAGFLEVLDAATGLPVHPPLPLGNPAFGGVALAEGVVVADTGTQSDNGSVVAFRPSA
jgi:polyvinyl alcohol dehydrogenase (cytochrome)